MHLKDQAGEKRLAHDGYAQSVGGWVSELFVIKKGIYFTKVVGGRAV